LKDSRLQRGDVEGAYYYTKSPREGKEASVSERWDSFSSGRRAYKEDSDFKKINGKKSLREFQESSRDPSASIRRARESLRGCGSENLSKKNLSSPNFFPLRSEGTKRGETSRNLAIAGIPKRISAGG